MYVKVEESEHEKYAAGIPSHRSNHLRCPSRVMLFFRCFRVQPDWDLAPSTSPLTPKPSPTSPLASPSTLVYRHLLAPFLSFPPHTRFIPQGPAGSHNEPTTMLDDRGHQCCNASRHATQHHCSNRTQRPFYGFASTLTSLWVPSKKDHSGRPDSIFDGANHFVFVSDL
jgi:hypothetical protein